MHFWKLHYAFFTFLSHLHYFNLPSPQSPLEVRRQRQKLASKSGNDTRNLHYFNLSAFFPPI